MSAFGGKADVTAWPSECLLIAISGHSSPMRGEYPYSADGLTHRASLDCHQQLIQFWGAPMAREGIERRLTTIMSADVVEYSRLMAADEAGTFAQLKTHRRELLEPKTAEHHGRVVKLTGDGTLMEFASVIDAVTFAVEVQQAMERRNADVPEDLQIKFRVGINLGEIIVDGEDIYGDGVNIAARLEGLAEPGGIMHLRQGP